MNNQRLLLSKLHEANRIIYDIHELAYIMRNTNGGELDDNVDTFIHEVYMNMSKAIVRQRYIISNKEDER